MQMVLLSQEGMFTKSKIVIVYCDHSQPLLILVPVCKLFYFDENSSAAENIMAMIGEHKAVKM